MLRCLATHAPAYCPVAISLIDERRLGISTDLIELADHGRVIAKRFKARDRSIAAYSIAKRRTDQLDT